MGILSLAAMVWQRVLLTDTVRNELLNHNYTLENMFILQFIWLILIPFYFLIGVAMRNQKTYKLLITVIGIHAIMSLTAGFIANQI